jgi:cysteinyl-tRNA synthetase
MLRLHDSVIGDVVELSPRDAGRFTMYVCGPTVYELPHIGHGRFNLTWDVVRRWMLFNGFDVTYVSNVTDIDDNIIERATREGRTETDVAAQYEDEWWRAMSALDVLRPDLIPHATSYVDKMIETISTLLASGHAYQIDDGVYLDTSTVADYGLLAGQPLDSLRAGERVETNPQKRAPFDFVLWKAAKPGEPTWDAPFGPGRPGWHTECVVMSLELLGENFDLHTGGQDLRFPHHENERAQAVALGRGFARHWAHNGWVVVEGVKMSKSLANFTTLTDLLARSDPRAYRLLVLRAHYRSPIEVTVETIADAERALGRLDAVVRRLAVDPVDPDEPVRRDVHPVLAERAETVTAFGASMDDDLDTPAAVARLFDLATKANTLADEGNEVDARIEATVLAVLAGAIGLRLHGAHADFDPEIDALCGARDLARGTGDYAEADRLRTELESRGLVVEDTPAGTKVRPR